MKKGTFIKIALLICAFGVGNVFQPAFCDDAFVPLKALSLENPPAVSGEITIDLNRPSGALKTINLSDGDVFYHMIGANERFIQCNIRAAWEDFKTLINASSDNDFIYMSLANKMADLGLFDLANHATLKIKDKSLTNISTDAMRRFYFPRKKLKLDDEMILAEAYSNILYNNQSSEAVNELLKNETLLSNSDYANYLVALGSYKSSLYKQAAKYINIAILQNSSTLNYQLLKAKICVENKENEEALKTIENLKKQNLYAYEYERKIKSTEQFVLYKIARAQWEKDYHLGYYYYLENDSSKAIRTLQGTLSSKKRANKGMVYSLMGEIYLSMNEFEKALDMATKAHKSNSGNIKSLIVLGDLNYRDKKYKLALEYYKKAAAKDKKSYVALAKEAQTYLQLNNSKKASELFTKVLKNSSDNWEAYYNVALMDKSKEEIYLKKALAINPLFESGWIALAKIEINRANYDVAKKYLANAFFIDENDYRYYYYQGLICNNSGDYNFAKFNFKKCLKLNSEFSDAKKALDVLLYGNESLGQDSI